MADKSKNKIINNMRSLRVSREISVKKMAKDLGIGQNTIYDLEIDKFRPTLTHAYLIANYFDLPVTAVFQPVDLKVA